MHIPDGFLDPKTWITLDLVSATVVGISISKAKKKMGERHVPMMGVMAAFIFAAQMVNFPIIGGTSGHFMGGALAAILLSPSAGIIVMTTVLIVQCLLFQDGGLTALGANIFNMGVLGCTVSYSIYWLLNKLLPTERGLSFSSFIAGWTSIVLAASVCALELAISGTVPLGISLPAMAGIHSLIGIGEGLITAVVLSALSRVRAGLSEFEKV